jgi:Uncharacterised nucleotidyltransferase
VRQARDGPLVTDSPWLELFCRILRDEPFVWPELDPDAARRLYDAAREHGVHLLLAERCGTTADDCPPALRDRLAASLRNQLAVEEIVGQELRTVLAALGEAGIQPLLFKGTALAFTDYRDPVLRPRADTDVLVDGRARHAAVAAMERLGYRRTPFQSGELVMYQVPYGRTDRYGVRHTVDLHWQISNPQVFARAMRPADLLASSVRVSQLGDMARAPCAADSLALACVHRVAHHGDEDRLIWSYDVHLLAERLTGSERQDFVLSAAARQLTVVCAHELSRAQRRFHGRGTRVLLERLGARASTGGEPSEPYVAGRMRKIDVLISDLHALGGWRQRVMLLREHLFPPRAYMRQVYGESSAIFLPVLYVWRMARGAWAFCRRPVRPREPQE